jgi:glycosyltransferase involved in cell wall biosynthesis/sulfatase maturation enzyme AslB (radical SAM superfamily)
MTLISVVIPTYRRGKSTLRLLQGYLAALHECAGNLGLAYECILVDDYSNDGSFEFLQQSFHDAARVTFVAMPFNGGPGPAREVGVKLAKGEWIWFLDDDDALDIATLPQLLVTVMKAAPNIDVISHSLKRDYSSANSTVGHQIAKSIMSFQEYQEVFRHVVRTWTIVENGIHFSPGLHEDIRYVIELMLHARAVQILPQKIVLKNKTEGAVTARMSTERIDGYVRAFNEVNVLAQGLAWPTGRQLQSYQIQTLGVILLLINREEDSDLALKYLRHLYDCSMTGDDWSNKMLDFPIFGVSATNFELAGSIWRSNDPANPARPLIEKLREVFSTQLSCKDLDSSLFLGPDEIRACCKRFFVKGVRKGDVVLLKADDKIDLPFIESAKEKLIKRINDGSATECSGCPYIERGQAQASSISYLSLENFAYCNMRCTYCSPKYYGGTEASYNAANIVAQVAALPDGFDKNCHVVWGGGEPTLSPRFDAINRSLLTLPQSGKIRVLSNSLKYSTELEAQLHDSRFHLVTSIDAGTESTFRQIRGKSGIDEVIGNLVRYQKVLDDPRRLTVKYIVGVDNFLSAELQSFVEKIVATPLLQSFFQVSCDFTLDAPESELICSLYELSLRLLNAGARIVFFDDLVRDRVRMSRELAEMVKNHLAKERIDVQQLLTPDYRTNIVLWGAGKQAEWLMRHTTTGQSNRIIGIVTDANSYRTMCATTKTDDAQGGVKPCILPAGVQSMFEIVRNIEQAGYGSHLVRGILL